MFKFSPENLVTKIYSTWTRYASTFLYFAIGLAVLSILLRLLSESYRLIFSVDRVGAVDLRLRYDEIRQWFAGLPVYTSPVHTGYPPASYLMLVPFFGLLDMSSTRWLWEIITLAELALLAVITIQFMHTTARLERLVIILTWFSVYPITVTLGNGQLGIHVFILFWSGLLLLRHNSNWRFDFWGALLLTMALVKPSFSAPLFWLVLFALGRLRPMILVAVVYAGLTWVALLFQPEPRWQALVDFFKYNADVINKDGGAHIAVWMRLLGLNEWTTFVSLGMFMLLGLWVWRNRHADIWLVLGVSAIVARLWTYHRMYDDLLILFPMIALWRWIKQNPSHSIRQVLAGCLIGAAWLAMQMPASTVTFPFPWNLPYEIGLPIIWIAMLVLLDYIVRHERISVISTTGASSQAD